MLSKTGKRDLIYALYITLMVLVNTLGIKITDIFGIRVSTGIFMMPFLFLATDITGEVFGEEEVKRFVNISTAMLVLVMGITWLCVAAAPNESWPYQEQYSVVFGSSIRMTAASVISFAISQKLDVRLFALLKRLTSDRHLWLRNNVATITCNFIDTVIFDFIAFYKMTPSYTAGYIFSLIIPYFMFKTVFALLDTPFCYLGVKWLRHEKKPQPPRENRTPSTT